MSTREERPLLMEHHRVELAASSLSSATIAAARIESVSEPGDAALLIGREWSSAQVPAIAFPCFDRHQSVVAYYLKPDLPRRKKGRAVKYESPPGERGRLYFPPVVDATAWGDVTVPLILTEGIKKALALGQIGWPTISAQGTYMFHDAAVREATQEWKLHPDIAGVPVEGRVVVIFFDGKDTTENPHVIEAEARLARMLMDAGASVALARVPDVRGGGKSGIDDYLATLDAGARRAAVERLVSDAIPADPIRRAAEARKGDLDVSLRLLRDLSFWAGIRCADSLSVAAAREALGVRAAMWATASDVAAGTLEAQAVDEREVPEDVAADAEALLRDERLLQRFLEVLARRGVVGEARAAQTVLLAGVTRVLAQPVNLILKASSSSGKNHLLRHVLDLMPEGSVEWHSSISPQALRFFDRPGALKNKIFVVDEAEGGDKAVYDLRVMTSEGRLSLLVPQKVGDKISTVARTVEGPICLITTTTEIEIHDENETRTLEVSLDASAEQTGRIVDAAIRRATRATPDSERAVLEREKQIWRVALGMIEPVEVSIPEQLASALRDAVNPRNVRARRDIGKVIALVQAHAMLHQRQRARTAEGHLLAAEVDVVAAVQLCEALTAGLPSMLASACRTLSRDFPGTFTAKDAKERLGCSKRHAERLLERLVEDGIVEIVERGAGPHPNVYRVVLIRVTRAANRPDAAAADEAKGRAC